MQREIQQALGGGGVGVRDIGDQAVPRAREAVYQRAQSVVHGRGLMVAVAGVADDQAGVDADGR